MAPVSDPSPAEKPPPPRFWHRLAEERIRDAQDAGQFDNLPGFGKPIPGIDVPHDDLWWVKDKLRREQLSSLPPALAIALDIDQTLRRLAALPSAQAARGEIEALNERIERARFAPWGPAVNCQPLDIEETMARWRPAT
jgi:hypothetical protein